MRMRFQSTETRVSTTAGHILYYTTHWVNVVQTEQFVTNNVTNIIHSIKKVIKGCNNQ